MLNKTWLPKGQSVQALKESRELLISYWALHKEKPGRPLGWSSDDILNLYQDVMKELKANEVELEDYTEMDYISLEEKNKESVGMKEVLSLMSDFAVSLPSILLSGDIIKNGSTDGEIEVVLCGREHTVPNLLTIEMKKAILEMFPKKFWSRIKFKSFNGSAEEYPGKHVSLYNPIFRRFYDTGIREGSYFAKTGKQNIEVLSSAEEVIGQVFKTWNKK